MTQKAATGSLAGVSQELAGIVERVAPSIVRVDDGTRLTATGLIWAADGVIVTTSHGVERDEELAIELADGTRHTATLVGRDPDTDVAVLRVQAAGLPALSSAGIDEVKVGQLVLALGRPGQSGLHATLGILSARYETQTNGEPGFIAHTDADLYPGFSGGAMVDVQGRLVGMTNLMYGRGRGVAISGSILGQVVTTLLSHGRVARGYLGVRTQQVTLPEKVREGLEPKQERALLVVQVEPGSPAEQGGLMQGDTLLRINNHPVQDGVDLRQHLRTFHAGQAVSLHIVRGGEPRDLSITLGAAE